jgi:60 kDa SS-A/Ro ribonucleoprotein
MRVNKPNNEPKTHEGAPAFADLTPLQQLRRSVLACLLWEDSFYESGVSIAERIQDAARKVTPEDLAALAIEARQSFNLRHAPLLLLDVLTSTGSGRKDGLVRNTIAQVISRADELAEFVALYWRNGKHPLSGQMKKGLADAFTKFDAYQLAKYNRDHAIKLRDVMFLVHPKPGEGQDAIWKKLADQELESPDTWEVSLSAGTDKKETFERLLREGKLGYLALLRNLRNMEQAGVDAAAIISALKARKGARQVLPFRFIAAAKAAPTFEPAIDEAMLASFAEAPKLPGNTLVIIDVSGSMYGGRMSKKSDMNRALAASALGAIARELCEIPLVYATAGSDTKRQHQTEQVPARRGMALVDAIYDMRQPLGGGGIFLTQVCDFLRGKVGAVDRTIVITDEQDCDVNNKAIAEPIGRGYLINVASYRNGIGYGPWTHIDGFSERVFRFILEAEAGQ